MVPAALPSWNTPEELKLRSSGSGMGSRAPERDLCRAAAGALFGFSFPGSSPKLCSFSRTGILSPHPYAVCVRGQADEISCSRNHFSVPVKLFPLPDRKKKKKNPNPKPIFYRGTDSLSPPCPPPPFLAPFWTLDPPIFLGLAFVRRRLDEDLHVTLSGWGVFPPPPKDPSTSSARHGRLVLLGWAA